MAKSDPVVIPFPAPASSASADRPIPDALPELSPDLSSAQQEAGRALLHDLILLYGQTQAARRDDHE
ncbi:MAG: hypothetical protein ACN6O6_19795 [Pseudomonas sp.]|uniref:hypothetical protein n=1 Tax=Pseudomonas sp. TaxID=306 RepID=UPI003D0FA60B